MTEHEATASRVAWISHPLCLQHEMGPGHPECPDRLRAIESHLEQRGVLPQLQRLQAPLVTREALLRVHDAALVADILDVPVQGYRQIDPDTVMNVVTADAALHAAGAAVMAVDAVRAGQVQLAFCAVRPPGHHAERHRAMGFCFFNNIAVGVAHGLASGLERVAVLDFDVHFGNGTGDIFRDDPRVLVCNTYQSPLYPYWESDPGNVHLVDVALKPGADGAAFRAAVEQRWWPALEAHAPQLIFVSAGFDAHAADPLAHLRLQEEDYTWIGAQLRQKARDYCNGHIVASLEGGYDLQALAHSTAAFLGPFLSD